MGSKTDRASAFKKRAHVHNHVTSCSCLCWPHQCACSFLVFHLCPSQHDPIGVLYFYNVCQKEFQMLQLFHFYGHLRSCKALAGLYRGVCSSKYLAPTTLVLKDRSIMAVTILSYLIMVIRYLS